MSRPIASRVARPPTGGPGQASSDFHEPLVSQTYVNSGDGLMYLQARDEPREGIIRLCVEKPAFMDDTAKNDTDEAKDEDVVCTAHSPRASDPCVEKWETRYLSLRKGVLSVYEVPENGGRRDILGRLIGGPGKLIDTHNIDQLLTIRVSYGRSGQLGVSSPGATRDAASLTSGAALDPETRSSDSNEFSIRLAVPMIILVDGQEREQYSTVTWRICAPTAEEANLWILSFMRAITLYVLPSFPTPPVTPSPVADVSEERHAYASPRSTGLPGDKPLGGLSFAKAPIESPATSDTSPKPFFTTSTGGLGALRGSPSPLAGESPLANDLRSLSIQRKTMPVSCSMGSTGFLSQVQTPGTRMPGLAPGARFDKFGTPPGTGGAPDTGLSFAKQGIAPDASSKPDTGFFKKEPPTSFLASSLRTSKFPAPISEIKEEEEEESDSSTPKMYVPPSQRQASKTEAASAGLYVPPIRTGDYQFGRAPPKPQPTVIFGDHAPDIAAGPPAMCPPASIWQGSSSTSGGIWLAQGPRSSMEDTYIMEDNVVEYLRDLEIPEEISSIISNPKVNYEHIRAVEKTSIYAIFDGHSGKFAADYAALAIPVNLVNHPSFTSDNPQDLSEALKEAFRITDDDFLRSVHQAEAAGDKHKKWTSGTTALAMLVRGSHLIVASVGDCRALMSIPEQPKTPQTRKLAPNVIRPCNCEFKPIALSADHTPLSEQQRIVSAGGWVTTESETQIPRLAFFDRTHLLVQTRIQQKQTGTRKIIVSRINGDLGVARSIGDADYKGEGMKNQPWCWPKGMTPRPMTSDLIIATPDITRVSMDSPNPELVEQIEKEVNGHLAYHTRHISFNRDTYKNCSCRPFVIMACDGLWDVLSDPEVTAMTGAQLAAQRYKKGRASTDEEVEDGAIAAARSLTHTAIRLGTCDNVTTLVLPL